MTGQLKNGQLSLIKINENKCPINGKLYRQMIANQRIGGEHFLLKDFTLRFNNCTDETICTGSFLNHFNLLPVF